MEIRSFATDFTEFAVDCQKFEPPTLETYKLDAYSDVDADAADPVIEPFMILASVFIS